jgi:hypothetical protein
MDHCSNYDACKYLPGHPEGKGENKGIEEEAVGRNTAPEEERGRACYQESQERKDERKKERRLEKESRVQRRKIETVFANSS